MAEKADRDSARPRLIRGLLALASLGLCACDPAIGEEGTKLPISMAGMSGGVVFSTAAIPGAKSYDLFWAPNSNGPNLEIPIQLTTTESPDVQPSVSGNGQAMVFVRQGEGIFLANAEGRISRITKDGGSIADSLPALSYDGDRVAWVRTHLNIPVGQGFAQSEIWVASSDGSGAFAVNPKPFAVQDAPAFEPVSGSSKLAWSEFSGVTLTETGPVDYGVWVQDIEQFAGRFICQGEVVVGEYVARCFGQHLSWPDRGRIVLAQQMLEIDPINIRFGSFLPEFVDSLASSVGSLQRQPSQGFFTPFPISASFARGQMIADGVFQSFEGDDPTLAFFIAESGGQFPRRYQVDGFRADIDVDGTAGYLFSLATPQLVP